MSKQVEHTPGPWGRVAYKVFAATTQVAECTPDNGEGCFQVRDGMECVANARLIAAAPDMLTVLVGILTNGLDAQWIDGKALVGEGSIMSWRNETKKVLAKAEGEA